ncbi:MAG: hypothetical protein KDK12_18820 [Rhodobacteraceae bacterium]|nr:hypothetical protein [Paracoccaceae bacterium]
MHRLTAPILMLALCAPSAPVAQTLPEARLPVFGQTVRMPLIFGTEPDFALETPEGFSILEWVPEGETVEHWTQMQTLTGHRDLGGDRDAEGAAQVGEAIAVHFLDGYRRACAVAVDAVPLPLTRDQNARASFAAYLGCAQVSGEDHAEEMVILVMVGAHDSYTLQWAERSPAREAFDREAFSRWHARIDTLSQARLCGAGAATDQSCD